MAVVAEFIADVLTGVAPLTVQFTNLSSGGPTAFLWDFGDGYNSDLANPLHVYANDGSYTVKLRAYIPGASVWRGPTWIDSLTSHKNSKPPNWHPTNIAAHDKFTSNPFIVSGIGMEGGQYMLSNRVPTKGGYQYNTYNVPADISLLGLSSRVCVLKMYLWVQGIPGGTIQFSNGLLFGYQPVDGFVIVGDVTNDIGNMLHLEYQDADFSLIPDPGAGNDGFWYTDNIFVNAYSVTATTNDVETKTNYIVVGEPCVVTGWMMINRQLVVALPAQKDLVVNTNKKAHLWAQYRGKKFKKRLKWRIKYGMKYRCSPFFKLRFDGEIEQLEAGETFQHTFSMLTMPGVNELSVILRGSQCGELLAARSPVMLFDNSDV